MWRLWPRKQNDVRLDAQEAILSAACDEMKEVTERLGVVKDKLVKRANGSLHPVPNGGLYEKQPR